MAKSDAMHEIQTSPTWDTWVMKRTGDGRLLSRDNSVWLYREVPMGPVLESTDDAAGKSMGDPLAMFFDGLAQLASSRGNRRMTEGSFREFHVLRLAVPFWFEAPPRLATASMLNTHFRDRLVMRKSMLVGVRLRASTGTGGWRSAVDSVVDTMASGRRPMSDFDKDFDRIDRIMRKCGFETPTADTLRVAQSWWTYGHPRAVPVLPHHEHLHFFESMAAQREVEQRHDKIDCEDWNETLPGQGAVSFLNVQEVDVDRLDPGQPASWFLADIEQYGVRAVSIRGRVEPTSVTRRELRGKRNAIRRDNQEAANVGVDGHSELEEREAMLDMFERSAGLGALPPTLVDTSIVLAVNGVVEDADAVQIPRLTLTPMTNAQGSAWHETMIGSSVWANPTRHDLSSHLVAYSGLVDQTVLGEGDESRGPLALLGFSHDDMPVWVSPRAAWSGDSEPCLSVGMGTGAGKTTSMQWLAYQWALQGVPIAFVDPKPDSDLRNLLRLLEGSVPTRDVSLDNLASSDGAIDPIVIYKNSVETAINASTSMLSQVGPWSPETFRLIEPRLKRALAYGIEHGATGGEQALRIAIEAGQLDESLVASVFELAETTPMLRATFGTGKEVDGSLTAVGRGLTLFRAGAGGFTTPVPGQPLADQGSPVRASVNLLRMLLQSAVRELAGKGGVLILDEAWIIDLLAPDELKALGRMARSMGVLIIYMTQTPSATNENGMKGFFSRALTGYLKDKEQAKGALDLMGLSHERWLDRVTAPRSLGGGRGLNYRSLRALIRKDETGKNVLVRPTQMIYADLESNVGAVTVEIPPPLLEMFSTTPDDPDDEPLAA